jgi:hypothetical protein
LLKIVWTARSTVPEVVQRRTATTRDRDALLLSLPGMLRSSPVSWVGVPSAIDGIALPNLTITRGEGRWVGFLVSEWRAGECSKAFSVEFARALAYCAVDETLYSIGHRADLADRSCYLRRSESTPEDRRLIEIAQMTTPAREEFQPLRYLLVGLDECVEVLSASPPTVTEHGSYDSACEWLLRKLR